MGSDTDTTIEVLEDHDSKPAAKKEETDDEDCAEIIENPVSPDKPDLDVMRCSPPELAAFLDKRRFDNPSKTVEFLKAALGWAEKNEKAVASIETIVNTDELGSDLTNPQEVSMISPRGGKFMLTMKSQGLFAQKITSTDMVIQIPANHVTHAIMFPKPEDCCKSGGTKGQKITAAHLVLLRLSEPIMYNKKEVSMICVQLPFEKKIGAIGPAMKGIEASVDNEGSVMTAADQWQKILVNSLGGNVVITCVPFPFTNKSSNSFQFSSYQQPGVSTTTGSLPFVRCYKGVQDGALYPLEEGLLFFKPALFLPRSLLHSISIGRGSSSSSRYVDMSVKLEGEDLEFSNIERDELAVLDHYIKKVLIPAMAKDVRAEETAELGGSSSGKAGSDDDNVAVVQVEGNPDHNPPDDETSDEDDDDFVAGADEDDDDESDDDADYGDGDSNEGVVVVDEGDIEIEGEIGSVGSQHRKRDSIGSATESENENPLKRPRR